MKNPLAFLIIGLFFGTGLGFLLAASTGAKLEGHDHSNPDHHGATEMAHHKHGDAIDVSDASQTPSIDIKLHEDIISGWNLEIIAENFEFSPQSVNKDHVAGTGHAHVYVNGEKLARLYANWLHIPALPSGETTVSVTLNSNDHRTLSVNGKALSAEKIVTVP